METVKNAPTIDSGEAPDLYVPNYMSFNNDNIFLGSFQGLRFKMTPDIKEMTILAEYWYGPLCYEKSQMDGQDTFPLSEEGIANMTAWIRNLAEHPPEKE